MSSEILDKLKTNKELTSEEIYYVINEIVKLARERLNNVPISNLKKCNESNNFVGNICERLNIIYFPLTTQNLNNDDLFHKFGLIIFNENSHMISYLVDLTYDQFIENKEYNKMLETDLFKLKFSNRLISDGYLPFTKEVFVNYINSFLHLNKKNNNAQLYESMSREFNRYKIEFNKDEDYYYLTENKKSLQ